MHQFQDLPYGRFLREQLPHALLFYQIDISHMHNNNYSTTVRLDIVRRKGLFPYPNL